VLIGGSDAAADADGPGRALADLGRSGRDQPGNRNKLPGYETTNPRRRGNKITHRWR
jgi:hypothetical protein